jgi:hypothetical protein
MGRDLPAAETPNPPMTTAWSASGRLNLRPTRRPYDRPTVQVRRAH